jgi:hypothetical protein
VFKRMAAQMLCASARMTCTGFGLLLCLISVRNMAADPLIGGHVMSSQKEQWNLLLFVC